MDSGLEAFVGFVAAHGDTFEFLELAEEVLDQMTPLVHLGVDRERLASTRVLGDHDLGAACIEIGDDGVAVEGRVGDEGAEVARLQQRFDPDRVVALPGQQNKPDESAERVGQSEDFGGYAAFGTTNGLA